MSKFLISFLLLVSLSSCLLRPKYTPPYVDVPSEWRTESDPESVTANLWWWKQFQDPVLNELIVIAIANNYDLKVAVARVDEYYGRLGVVSSQLYPQINLTGLGIRQEVTLRTSPPTPPQFRYFNTFSTVLNTTYELDIWGRVHSATDAALAELLAQVEAQRTVVLTLVSATAGSYVRLRQFDKQLVIARQTYESREKSFRLAVIRHEGGLTSEMEVKQAESEMQTALLRIKDFELAIAVEENQLSVLLGWNPTSIMRGNTLDELTLPPCVPAGLPSDLLHQRPDILQAEDILMATGSRIGEAKAAFFPQISLTAAFGYQSTELGNLFTSQAELWQYGLSLIQPIFTGGRLTAQLEIARAQNREALFTYFNTIINAFKEVDDALIAHQKSLELVAIQQKQVGVLKDYLQLANKQYNAGQIEYLNVLDAERKLFESQLSLVQLQGDSFLTLIDLYKALGGGWGDAVFEDSPLSR